MQKMLMSIITVTMFAGSAALAGCGGGGTSSGSSPSPATTNTTTTSAQTVSSQDCNALGSVVSDLTVGAHAAEVEYLASDISASDYVVDRDFVDDYANRVPGDLRADVLLLGKFLDRYASAAQNVGVEPRAVLTPDQWVKIRRAASLASIEQDKVPGSIQALKLWTANGCSGGRPPTETTPTATSPAPTTESPTSPVAKASADAAVGDSVEEVTAAINAVMGRRTEEQLGSPPLGSEVRNCRKERDFSANSLLAPGGAAYFCEVWHDGEKLSDAGPAIIAANGKVFSTP